MWAHSGNLNGVRHSLVDHLRGCAALARGFAEPIGFADLAWWTALAHDGGKAWCCWQDKLLVVEPTGDRVGLDHKSFGVQLARRHGLRPAEFVIAGHHGGLTRQDSVDELFGKDDEDEDRLRAGPWADAERSLQPLVPELFDNVPALPPIFSGPTDRLTQDFATRFLYSCVVDADALDTQAHFQGFTGPRLGAVLDAPLLLDRFLTRRKEFLLRRPRSAMDGVRESVFAEAMRSAVQRPGLFKMTAPTGAAKTIAAAAFALRHAALHDKRRVIVAMPFITITEQNAAVYRRLLNDDHAAVLPVVLEHHSNVDLDRTVPGRHRSWHRLASENWDAPFVVTTTVQLLESLFGRKPAQMRKVHRLANSVIIFDEVQALPHRLLPQIADALRILTDCFGTTVLLSSATQPELWSLSPLSGLDAREIVADTAATFRGSRRHRFRWRLDPKPTISEIVDEATGYRRVLVVLNTVRDARSAFERARAVAAPDTTVLHLSTGMCPAHRRAVLRLVNERLAAGQPVCLISTSLVEAGVDVDFPVAYRSVGPPDSLAQVAGRCNREGLLGPDGGLVVIFDPSDGGMPPSYRVQIDVARMYFGPDVADPDNLTTLRSYFEHLYRTLDVEGKGSVAKTIERHRWDRDFLGVADGPLINNGMGRDRTKAFRLILDDTVPVVVPYGSRDDQRMVQETLTALCAGAVDVTALRRLQPYVTTVRRSTAQRPEVAELTEPVVGDLLRWRGDYDPGYGLVIEPRGEDFLV